MAQVHLVVGGRHYRVACQDGGEDHLRQLAGVIDRKIGEVTRSMGGVDEPRQLLFAALLLADEVADLRQVAERAAVPRPPPPPAIDPSALRALERLADRIETLADGLEQRARSA